MSEFMSYDPWKNITTRNGLPGDEVVSGLQKSIRRGNAEKAIEMAYEMYITSPQFLEKLWRRLQVIAVEDIGFGNVNAPVVVRALRQIASEFPYSDGDQPIFFMHAIRFLCGCAKERSTDCLKNIVIKKFEHGYQPEVPDYAYDVHTHGYQPEVPDYAYDVHTDKGRAMGRDVLHFLNEASRVTPVMEGYDDTYRQQLIEVIEKEQDGQLPVVDGAFSYNVWQY